MGAPAWTTTPPPRGHLRGWGHLPTLPLPLEQPKVQHLDPDLPHSRAEEGGGGEEKTPGGILKNEHSQERDTDG